MFLSVPKKSGKPVNPEKMGEFATITGTGEVDDKIAAVPTPV